MRILVTGGAGFIGSHLVECLVDQGQDVVVLDSVESRALPRGVTFVRGNVGDPDAADRALAGVDRVVHLAAAVGVSRSMWEIASYVRENTMATATFLERLVAMSPRPHRIVVASSMSIYGEGEYVCADHGHVAPAPRRPEQLSRRAWECLCPSCGGELHPVGTRESKPLIPISVYAITKRDHEELCLVIAAAYGIPAVALRLFNVYGRGQTLSNPYTGVAAQFASRLLNDRPPVVFEDGLQSRDFIHVSDVVDGIVLALESESAIGAAVNLGTGRPTTVNVLAKTLAEGLDVELEPIRMHQFRAGDIRHCYADPRRARELLGFEPSVSLEEGMRDLIAWLEGQEAVDRVDTGTRELVARGLAR